MMKKFFLILLTIIGLTMSLSAQNNKTVQWRLTVKMTSATEGVATIKGMIEPGWHLYGTKAVKNGPQPTVIDFSQSTGIKLIGKPAAATTPVTAFDKLFEQTLSWWEGTATFRQKFKVTDKAKAQVKCSVRYTTCNNVTCSMPVSETFAKSLPK